MSKINNARKLVNRISENTGKQWPTIDKVLGSGSNGITFLTTNNPPKVLKIAVGDATREVQALRKLHNDGSNFTPKLSNNYVSIRKNTNVINKLFPYRNKNNNNKSFMTAYVMNKVGNTSLWSYVKSGHNTANNKRQIRESILKAINFMHAQGISHGDLHAGNILVELDNEGKMKKLWVIDFGRYVNIQPGKTENNTYKALPSTMHRNYNVFNSTAKPLVEMRTGPMGPSRRNLNLYKYMYQGNNKKAQV